MEKQLQLLLNESTNNLKKEEEDHRKTKSELYEKRNKESELELKIISLETKITKDSLEKGQTENELKNVIEGLRLEVKNISEQNKKKDVEIENLGREINGMKKKERKKKKSLYIYIASIIYFLFFWVLLIGPIRTLHPTRERVPSSSDGVE
jgi:hypothetical protein